MSGPADIAAILADLQQQVSDLTGVVEAQQATLRDLTVIVQSHDHALRQLLPDSPRLPAMPPERAAVRPAPSGPSVPSAAVRSGGA